MLFGVETLDTHNMSNKHIRSNFFVVVFYLTHITSHFTPKCVKIYVVSVKSLDSPDRGYYSCCECQ